MYMHVFYGKLFQKKTHSDMASIFVCNENTEHKLKYKAE